MISINEFRTAVGAKLILDGYIRVSQVRGRKGESFISPTVQREEIGRWISANGAALGEMFEELDQSGARADRPLLTAAIERVESGASDGIVVAKLNRFGRSMLDGLKMIARIQKAGGTLVSVQQGFDLRTSTGQLVANILFAVAEWELDQTREQWDIARGKAIERGVYISRKAPIGYRKTKERRLEVDPTAGPVISELFQRRLAGESAEDLADFLNDSGLQGESGVQFSSGRVYKIIKNPAYCGTAYSGRHSKPDAHEALVEPADWQRCQFPVRGTHRWVEALVAGMVRCASCGAAMTSIRGRSRYGAANYYRCCARPGECGSPALARGDELDPLVEEFIFRHSQLGRPPAAEGKAERGEAAVAAARADLAAYRDNVALQRTLGPESFEAGLAKRSQLLERRLLELARAKRGHRSPGVDLEQLERDWPELSWEERREAVGQLIDFVVVERGKTPVIERAWVFRKDRGPVVSGRQRRIEFKRPPGERARLKGPRLWGEERIERELVAFFAERERVWPPYLEFATAGYARLHAQVLEWGGVYHWAPRLGVKIPGAVRWDQRRLRGALRPFLAGRSEWPGSAQFREAGLEMLYEAVRSNGGFAHWAEQFGLAYEPGNGGRRPRWPEERIERELGRFCEGRRVFPSRAEFEAAGLQRLYGALFIHGGRARWAEELGLELATGRTDHQRSGAEVED